ncbi:hypothetical protein EST38_g12849 [Candolleomyces aberdarensis]|uniref:DUF6697 domain-containing protein n=1 Tax=Candolleomyces aberdarensis TaxID=2316362 RepID=A0A4Q2D1D6_9AGAR|nr:hypothetical protein EST38_g12849 [Candolleomyces aberdarensis]
MSSSQEATAHGKRKVDTPPSPPRAIKRYRTLPGHQEPLEPATSTGSAPSCSKALNEDYEAKSGISRPIIKYKEEEAIVLPPDVIAGYLRDAPPLDIKPNPSDLHVRRDYLRLLLGGSDMQFFQKVEARNNPTGSKPRTLAFPKFDLNPAMPLIPGESGLILSKRPEVLEYSPLGLFRRDMSGEEEAVWQYLGEYETKVVGMMTGELFRQQDSKVQRAWAKTILKQKGHQAYRMVKVRISLRKRGLPIPSEAESKKTSDAATARGREKGKKKEKQEDKDQDWGDVNEEDIIGALSRGDEGVEIVRMQCVSYDRTFADHIKDNFYRYPEMLSEEKGSKEKEKRSKPKTQKRIHTSASSSRRPPIPERRKKRTPRVRDQDDFESDLEPLRLGSAKTVCEEYVGLANGKASSTTEKVIILPV